jgi:hypothetical protein
VTIDERFGRVDIVCSFSWRVFVKYAVLLSQTLDDLVKQVDEKLQSHWKPQGGLVVFEGTDKEKDYPCFFFAQAIVLVELSG